MGKKLLEKIVEMYKTGEISKENASILLNEIRDKCDDIDIQGKLV